MGSKQINGLVIHVQPGRVLPDQAEGLCGCGSLAKLALSSVFRMGGSLRKSTSEQLGLGSVMRRDFFSVLAQDRRTMAALNRAGVRVLVMADGEARSFDPEEYLGFYRYLQGANGVFGLMAIGMALKEMTLPAGDQTETEIWRYLHLQVAADLVMEYYQTLLN